MNEDSKKTSKKSSSAAVATVLLQSEFVKKGGRIISTDATAQSNSSWKKVTGR